MSALLRSGLACSLVVVIWLAGRADEPRKPAERGPLPKLPTGKELMALKVKQSQVLLEALAIEDYEKMAAAADELGRIARAAEFINAHKTGEYQVQTKLFERTVDNLAARARDKNLDAAMLAYLDMSMSCMKCHKYTRNPKDVRLPGLPPDNVIAK